jgi:hypothetical protein
VREWDLDGGAELWAVASNGGGLRDGNTIDNGDLTWKVMMKNTALSHGQLDGSFGRCALGEKRATASEETFGKETLAGSDSLRGYSARRRDHHGLEHRELLWILVNQEIRE